MTLFPPVEGVKLTDSHDLPGVTLPEFKALIMDSRAIVRAWYDANSTRYRADHDDPPQYASWLDEFAGLVPPRGRVLDLGCGCGVPASRSLAARGFVVTGVDLSLAQATRAKRLVPTGRFVVADMTRLELQPHHYDGVVCLFALIHVPVDEHRQVLERIREWLRPAGTLLITVGSEPWTGVELDWLGSGQPMYWSHGGAEDYRRWLAETGFELLSERFVPEGNGGHSLMLARAAAQVRSKHQRPAS